MIVVNCKQGSPEWFSARCGVISASNFGKFYTPTGRKSGQAEGAILTLVEESLTGRQEQSFVSDAMQDGTNREAAARKEYEFIESRLVRQVGFIYKDESKRIGCSPDGLVGKRGLEIKCPSEKTHVEYLMQKKLPTKYIPQVQGGMYVTGLSEWDFMSYCPGIESLIITIKRDDEYIKGLSIALISAVIAIDRALTERVKL